MAHNGSNLPGHTDALDRAIDDVLRRSFEVPPVAPLPFEPLPLDPVGTSGGGLLAGTLTRLVPVLAPKQVAGLILAGALWSTAGLLIYNAVAPSGPSYTSSRKSVSDSNPRRVVDGLLRPFSGLEGIYQDVVENPPSVSAVAAEQEERWEQVRQILSRWPQTPATARLSETARAPRLIQERVQIIEVSEGFMMSKQALLVTARVDGTITVALLDPGSGPIPETEPLDPVLARTGARYFTLGTEDVTALELTTGDEARLIPELLNVSPERIEPHR